MSEKYEEETKAELATSQTSMDDVSFDPNSEEIIRVRRKVDLRMMPLLALLYMFSFLDRVNIGNANVAGLSRDLKLTSDQYQMALTVFFVGYIVFEIPSNLFLKKLGPKRWVPLIMFLWGVVVTCLSAVTNHTGLYIARFFLGVFEAGLFPGIIYMISRWYTRRELAIRNGFFFCTGTLAGAFGGLLAYGISKLDGHGGLHGWQWIFIIEGCLTIVFSVIAFLLLPDVPETTTFLTKDEQALTIQRLRIDVGVVQQQEFSMAELKAAVLDYKIWIYGFNYAVGATCLFSLSLFIPSIILQFKYDTVTTQLMTVPAFLAASVVTLLVAWSSDRNQERGLHQVGPLLLGCLGYILLIVTKDSAVGARYTALTVTACGVFSTAPASFASFSSNIAGHTKRAVATALIVSMGFIGGAAGANVYPATQAVTGYVGGHTLCACLTGAGALSCSIQKYMYMRENRRRDNLTPEQYAQEAEGENLCDKHPAFRYST